LQSALSHPNVVSVLGVAKARIETHRMHAAASDVQYVLKEDENAFVMINEYCPEGSLSDWMGQLREGKIAFCERQCIDIMIDVSLGMAYLHHQKILHKDLKPANILLLGGARKAKIGDFGLAKVTKRRPQDIGRSRTYIEVEKNGSLFFIAPEVCREGVCTVAADVFSFGIILHNVFDSWRELLSYPPNRVLYPDFGIEAYEQVFLHKLLEDDFRPLFSPQQDSKMSPLVYDEIVSLAAKCWDVDWRKRPSFPDIVEILRSLKSRAEEALCMEPKAAEFGTNDNNSTQGMSRVSDTRVDAFAYPPGRENSTASKPSPTRSELMGNQHGAGAPTPPGFGQPGLQLAPLVKERQVSSTPPGFGRPDRPLTLAPPGFGRRSPPQAPPFSAESPVLPRQYYDWQLVRPAPLVNERQVSLVTGNDRNCIHINQDSMCRRTITDESFLSGSFGSGGACNPEVLSSPPSLTFFLPIEKLSAMETALELPQDNVSSSVSLIAKSLGLEDDIESIPTLKNKVQRLWKEFEDSEEELNEISQLVPAFNLVECVQRIKKDLRIGDKETLVEIIYEASVLLGIEKECNKLPTIKLRTKRICIDLGHLPEELLTILESL
jgi:serine/threonine protein kinase